MIFVKLREMYPDDYSERINALDEEGAALLHYTCALDFDAMIYVFDEFGVDFNFKTKHGLSPFIIAAAKGNEVRHSCN